MQDRQQWDLARITVLVWCLLTIGLAVDAYCHYWRHTVYPAYAAAARAWWDGADMYVKRQQEGAEFYRYSPLFAIAVTPFAVLPDGWGCALWKVCNIAIYVVGLGAWARQVLPKRWSRAERAALFLLVLPGSLPSMYNGQANLIMLGALFFALAAAAREHWNGAAGWLALATLIKGYPLGLGLILCALRPRRFAPRLALALAIGGLLPFLAQRPAVVCAEYASWFRHLQDSTVIMRERTRSIDHLFLLVDQPLGPRTFGLLGMAAGGCVLGLCLLHARSRPAWRVQLADLFVWFAVWTALFGPATESCTYAVMAPAVAWALVEARRRAAPWAARAWLFASLLLMGPLTTDLFGPYVRNFATTHGSQPLGALLFAVYLVVLPLRSRRLVPEEQTPLPQAA